MATVVVVLLLTFDASSTWAAAVVMAASVVSGGISESVPTRVVFPTPKPPATMIFAERGADLFVAVGGVPSMVGVEGDI